MKDDLSTIAKKYLDYGLCVLPIEKKVEKNKYNNTQTIHYEMNKKRTPSRTKWDEWGETAEGIAIVTGKRSGNLICIDFLSLRLFEVWRELLPQDLTKRFVLVSAQAGIRYVYVRCVGIAMKTAMLARTAEGNGLIKAIGEGDWVEAPPTWGCRLFFSTFSDLPVLSYDEMKTLLDAAKSFDEWKK